MTRASNIVRCLLEADPDDVDPESYLQAITREQDFGKVTANNAMTTSHFYHRTKRYKGRNGKPGGPLEVRRNGKTQTWKRRPGHFRIPVKYGMYEYTYIDQDNADEWATIPDFKERWEQQAEKTRIAQQSRQIKQLMKQPLGADPQAQLPIQPRDPNQPELFNEHSRLRELGLY